MILSDFLQNFMAFAMTDILLLSLLMRGNKSSGFSFERFTSSYTFLMQNRQPLSCDWCEREKDKGKENI